MINFEKYFCFFVYFFQKLAIYQRKNDINCYFSKNIIFIFLRKKYFTNFLLKNK